MLEEIDNTESIIIPPEIKAKPETEITDKALTAQALQSVPVVSIEKLHYSPDPSRFPPRASLPCRRHTSKKPK
jgi:hypothetical protein